MKTDEKVEQLGIDAEIHVWFSQERNKKLLSKKLEKFSNQILINSTSPN